MTKTNATASLTITKLSAAATPVIRVLGTGSTEYLPRKISVHVRYILPQWDLSAGCNLYQLQQAGRRHVQGIRHTGVLI